MNGTFINRVTGKDLYRPATPSLLIMLRKHSVAVKFLHNCNLYLTTSHGTWKKSCPNVEAAPTTIGISILYCSLLTFSLDLSCSYIRN